MANFVTANHAVVQITTQIYLDETEEISKNPVYDLHISLGCFLWKNKKPKFDSPEILKLDKYLKDWTKKVGDELKKEANFNIGDQKTLIEYTRRGF